VRIGDGPVSGLGGEGLQMSVDGGEETHPAPAPERFQNAVLETV